MRGNADNQKLFWALFAIKKEASPALSTGGMADLALNLEGGASCKPFQTC